MIIFELLKPAVIVLGYTVCLVVLGLCGSQQYKGEKDFGYMALNDVVL